jgi:hypothetical protein
MNYLDQVANTIMKHLDPDDLPDDDDINSLLLAYAVLLLAKGENVTREDVHNAWVAWMTARNKNHDSLVPFSELTSDTQSEDSPYVLAIRAAARELGR